MKINEFDQFISTISSVFSSFYTTDHQQLTGLKPSFRLIETEELSNYGLVRKPFVYSDQYPEYETQYYIQDICTHGRTLRGEEISIIVFHWLTSAPKDNHIYLRLMNYSLHQIQNIRFIPEDNHVSKILLDQNEFMDLINLLRMVRNEFISSINP